MLPPPPNPYEYAPAANQDVDLGLGDDLDDDSDDDPYAADFALRGKNRMGTHFKPRQQAEDRA